MHVFSSVVDRFFQIKCDLNSSFLLGKYLKVDLFPKTNQEIKLSEWLNSFLLQRKTHKTTVTEE